METEAKQIGSLLTDLPPLSIEDSTNSIAIRMTSGDLAKLQETASLPIPVLPICDEKHFTQCFRVMDASLPRRSSDDAGGELMVAAYRRKLSHLPKSAVSYLVDQVLERCRWFPTIAECLEIAAEWERTDREYLDIMRAKSALRRHAQEDMEAMMKRLQTADVEASEIAAMPDQWVSIADTRGLIRWDGEKHVQRPRLTSQ